MKKLLFVSAFAALAFASCKKDDSSPSNSQKIVGSWRSSFAAEDANGNKTLDANERVVDTASTANTTFNSDGTGSVTAFGGNFPIAWKINNNTQIIVTILGQSDTAYIHTLTSNELVIENRDSTYNWVGFKK